MNRPLTVLALTASCLISPATAQGTPDPLLETALHVLRRVSFGPTPADVAALRTGPTAVANYISAQLNPAATYGHPDLAKFFTAGSPDRLVPLFLGDDTAVDELARAQIAYATLSEWQLREVMVRFWETLFNTNLKGRKNYFKPAVEAANPGFSGAQIDAEALDYVVFLEADANELYRVNALGTFADLLQFTAKHVTMTVYLDTVSNVKGAPNENYARELLELHTMGQTDLSGAANYTQEDIVELARVFTGWNTSSANGFAFEFVPGDHDTGNKKLFQSTGSAIRIIGQTGPAGVTEGELVLAQLAGRPATKEYVCARMLEFFLGDGAGAAEVALRQAMEAAWGSDGDITAVLTVLLNDPVFLGSTYRLERAKQPLEACVSTLRAFDASLPTADSLKTPYEGMVRMGQFLFEFPSPDGYPVASEELVSPTTNLERFWTADHVLLPAPPAASSSPTFDLFGIFLPSTTSLDASAMAHDVLTHVHGPSFSAADQTAVRDAILQALAEIGTLNPPPPANVIAEMLLRSAAVATLSQSTFALK